jgi:uncharacterized protein YggE
MRTLHMLIRASTVLLLFIAYQSDAFAADTPPPASGPLASTVRIAAQGAATAAHDQAIIDIGVSTSSPAGALGLRVRRIVSLEEAVPRTIGPSPMPAPNGEAPVELPPTQVQPGLRAFHADVVLTAERGP